MCIFCDLDKTGKAKQDALIHTDYIITSLERLTRFYKQIKSGEIKPHTEKMEDVVRCEKTLIQQFIFDI